MPCFYLRVLLRRCLRQGSKHFILSIFLCLILFTFVFSIFFKLIKNQQNFFFISYYDERQNLVLKNDSDSEKQAIIVENFQKFWQSYKRTSLYSDSIKPLSKKSVSSINYALSAFQAIPTLIIMNIDQDVSSFLRTFHNYVNLNKTFDVVEYISTVIGSLLSTASLSQRYSSQALPHVLNFWNDFPFFKSSDFLFSQSQTIRKGIYFPAFDPNVYGHVITSIELESFTMHHHHSNKNAMISALKLISFLFSSSNPLFPFVPDVINRYSRLFSPSEAHLSLYGTSLYSNILKSYLLTNDTFPILLKIFNEFSLKLPKFEKTQPFYHIKNPLTRYEINISQDILHQILMGMPINNQPKEESKENKTS